MFSRMTLAERYKELLDPLPDFDLGSPGDCDGALDLDQMVVLMAAELGLDAWHALDLATPLEEILS